VVLVLVTMHVCCCTNELELLCVNLVACYTTVPPNLLEHEKKCRYAKLTPQ